MTPPDIPGADAVVGWFGQWPSFHDAEILSIHINRGGRSIIRIHAWNFSGKVDAKGYWIRDREGIVVFEFDRIKDIRLEGENADVQNVISGLWVEETQDGYRLILGPCYGVAGELVVEHLSVRVEPGQ